MIYLRDLHITRSGDSYPFTVGALKGLDSLRFTKSVTFFAGDNGSGKSTLLEAIARKVGMPALGQYDTREDFTLKSVEPLAYAMKIAWARKPYNSFFLRSEDFFGFIKRLSQMKSELMTDYLDTQDEYEGRSEFAKQQAAMPYLNSLFELEHRYGVDPSAQSHGESYMSIFESRMNEGGLYLLDEPESALSPVRQMALLTRIHALSGSSQFLIATHSPILLALPDAEILGFDSEPARPVAWEELEQIDVLRRFMRNPEQMLSYLLREEE